METSKAQRAFDLLRRDILDAQLPPEAPLPVSSLKARYGLGWTPLREALSRLERERLVSFSPNKGYSVAGVSAEELLDLQKARKAVESSLLAESIAVGDVEWEKRLVAAHYEFKQTKPLYVMMPEPELTRWVVLHRSFHRALLSGATAVWLHRLCEQINDHLDRHHRALVLAIALTEVPMPNGSRYTDTLSRASSIEDHTQLMEASLARDTATALALLHEHIGLTLAAYDELRAAGST